MSDLEAEVVSLRASLVEVIDRLTNTSWSSDPEDRIRVAVLHAEAALSPKGAQPLAFGSPEKTAGKMWDEYRRFLDGLLDAHLITLAEYWRMTDLVNDYGFAMKYAGMLQQGTHSVARIFKAVTGDGERSAKYRA